jgi:hypothetical protein
MSLDHSTQERRKSARSRRSSQQLRLLGTLQHEEDGARRRLQAMRCCAVLCVCSHASILVYRLVSHTGILVYRQCAAVMCCVC